MRTITRIPVKRMVRIIKTFIRTIMLVLPWLYCSITSFTSYGFLRLKVKVNPSLKTKVDR